jgi:carboxypeptidase family protein
MALATTRYSTGSDMMRSRDLLSLILSLLFLAALSVSSRAQAVYGSVFGTVTDPQGARVVGAVVTVTDLTKNVTTTAQTNESGNYTVTHLIPGRYSLKVEHQGYKIIIQEIEVRVDVAARTDFSLGIETVTGQVTVTAGQSAGSLDEDGQAGLECRQSMAAAGNQQSVK